MFFFSWNFGSEIIHKYAQNQKTSEVKGLIYLESFSALDYFKSKQASEKWTEEEMKLEWEKLEYQWRRFFKLVNLFAVPFGLMPVVFNGMYE